MIKLMALLIDFKLLGLTNFERLKTPLLPMRAASRGQISFPVWLRVLCTQVPVNICVSTSSTGATAYCKKHTFCFVTWLGGIHGRWKVKKTKQKLSFVFDFIIQLGSASSLCPNPCAIDATNEKNIIIPNHPVHNGNIEIPCGL
jgi:hypothetical protein